MTGAEQHKLAVNDAASPRLTTVSAGPWSLGPTVDPVMHDDLQKSLCQVYAVLDSRAMDDTCGLCGLPNFGSTCITCEAKITRTFKAHFEDLVKTNPRLPHIKLDEPIRARKEVCIYWNHRHNRYVVAGPIMGSKDQFYTGQPARCHASNQKNQNRHHMFPEEIPGEECTCGYYALKASALLNNWVADVELYGKIVECEYGFRAQKQRIMRLSPGKCSCGRASVCGIKILQSSVYSMQQRVIATCSFLCAGEGLRYHLVSFEHLVNSLKIEIRIRK
jgi:hypothetical protein